MPRRFIKAHCRYKMVALSQSNQENGHVPSLTSNTTFKTKLGKCFHTGITGNRANPMDNLPSMVMIMSKVCLRNWATIHFPNYFWHRLFKWQFLSNPVSSNIYIYISSLRLRFIFPSRNSPFREPALTDSEFTNVLLK